MEFSELKLHPDLQRGLNEAGYITCMPVQEEVLKHAFSGQDLYVQSQTGTGKTAAFLVVIFQRLLTEDMLHGKKAIIMVPTRELAVQVEEEAKLIGKFLPFKIGSFYGGVGYTQQTALLRDNVQILVGTPGRVLDLNQSRQMNLMEITFLILDEADRMFDMGFYPDLRKLIRAVPPADRRQTMLFSATLNAWVKNLAWEYTRNPFEIAIEPETVTVEEVEQVLYHVSSADKMKLLLGIMERENPESTLIFCNTKRYAEIVAKRLRLNGLECEYIMGDLPQTKRLKIIEDIKAGKLRVLVATDVAARGLDIEGLALVVNYDLPNESENYVHRIGRTARAGKTGKAISFASEQDVYELPAIERYIGRKVPSITVTEDLFAADKSEGKHIHTEYYEERPSRDDRSRGRRGDRDARRDREARRDRPGTKGRGRERQKAEKRQTVERDSRDLKLSELSLEDRMAYYRQKYDTSEGDASAQTPAAGSGGEPRFFRTSAAGSGNMPPKGEASPRSGKGKAAAAPREKNGGRAEDGTRRRIGPKAGSEEPGFPSGSKNKRRDKKHKRGNQKRGDSKPAAGNSAAPAAQESAAPAAEKKGLLKRIFGIFKK